MRVVVIGATGNVGTSVLRTLVHDERIESIVGVARRRPRVTLPRVDWHVADVGTDPLVPVVRGADVVVHLAWQIQPQHDEPAMFRTNVIGTNRVLDAVARARVPALVYASSVGTYAPGPKEPVDETWSTSGIPGSGYSRHKAMVEQALDAFERGRPDVRVVRMRTSLVFKRQAASEIARLFIGPLLPRRLVGPEMLRVLPEIAGLKVQATHGDDIALAYHLAITTPGAHGAFNVAADPVLDAALVAEHLHAMRMPVPPSVARAAMWATFRAHLQPSEPGWLAMGRETPLIDSGRIRRELGWSPARPSLDALVELLEGIRDHAGGPTHPLEPERSGPVVPIVTAADGAKRAPESVVVGAAQDG